MDIGRRQNADPRWILPLLCRRGHITRNEIGAIRIGPGETHFQVRARSPTSSPRRSCATAGTEDGGDVRIEPSPEAPATRVRPHRKTAGPRGHAGLRTRARGVGHQRRRPANEAKPGRAAPTGKAGRPGRRRSRIAMGPRPNEGRLAPNWSGRRC
jgi:ATP-dependent RNA helicase DeaD